MTASLLAGRDRGYDRPTVMSAEAPGDSPDLDLTTTKSILDRTLVLPGGATTCKNYPDTTETRW